MYRLFDTISSKNISTLYLHRTKLRSRDSEDETTIELFLFRLVLFHMVLRAGDDSNEVSACIYPRI